MSELSQQIIERRPAVAIVSHRAPREWLDPLLWGIEEEEIPSEVTEAETGGAAALAHDAAHVSALNVGIAFDGAAGEIALHHRDLAGRPPLFTLSGAEIDAAALMRLGKNAARLVKGDPLIFADALPPEPPREPKPRQPAPKATGERELIERIAGLVLAELANTKR